MTKPAREPVYTVPLQIKITPEMKAALVAECGTTGEMSEFVRSAVAYKLSRRNRERGGRA